METMSETHWNQPKELHIPVPYGHIAAKVWGSEHSEPVIALHGWLDNSGTFDRLIPLLSSNLQIVAIDASGHGLSSHKPPGSIYHFTEFLIDIKRVADYLKWNRFSFIGHSIGGIVALLYSSVFPEDIKNIVLLDIVKPASCTEDELSKVTRDGIESLLKVEQKMNVSAPVYSMDEARSRLIAGMLTEITPESADVLLKRGCMRSSCGKGVVFSPDIRIKATKELQKPSHETLKAFLRKVKCNMMIIIGNQSLMSKSLAPKDFNDFIDIYKENCKTFELIKVDGNHFVHLNNPERVAPHIDAFFTQHLGIQYFLRRRVQIRRFYTPLLYGFCRNVQALI